MCIIWISILTSLVYCTLLLHHHHLHHIHPSIHTIITSIIIIPSTPSTLSYHPHPHPIHIIHTIIPTTPSTPSYQPHHPHHHHHHTIRTIIPSTSPRTPLTVYLNFNSAQCAVGETWVGDFCLSEVSSQWCGAVWCWVCMVCGWCVGVDGVGDVWVVCRWF